MSIKYFVNPDNLKYLLGCQIVQIILEKGEVLFDPHFVIRGSKKVSFLVKKPNETLLEFVINVDDFVYHVLEDTEMITGIKTYETSNPENKNGNLYFTFPNRNLISSMEVVDELVTNSSGKELIYTKAIVINLSDSKQLLFYLDENPSSFAISYSNEIMYQFLTEDCYGISSLE